MFGSPVPRQPSRLHTQAEPGAYLRGSYRVPRRRPFIYSKPPYAIGSVSSLSGHAIAYRWRSLPRVRRHRASKPRGSSKRQLICASLSHTHYWYKVDILKVRTVYTSSARSIRYVRHSFPSKKMISQALFAIFFNRSLQATYGYQLTQTNYGTVYACSYDGSNAFTVLFFCAVENSNFSTRDYSMSLRLQQLGFRS